MGKFIYDSATRVEIEERALAHIQHVVQTKLRRGESFPFTWKDEASVGAGRTTVWVHQHAPIVFKFHGSRRPTLNLAWLTVLAYTASTAEGLYLVPEPAPAAVPQAQIDTMARTDAARVLQYG